jgi:AcrR family transcriptional regulator
MQVSLTFSQFPILNSPFSIPHSQFPMPTRQRLIDAALELFTQQGIAETTTKQIAEQAGVNEVTLFRQCGNKQGLLLAVLEESEIFDRLTQILRQQILRQHISEFQSPDRRLRAYAQAYLALLERVPELLRSVVGESGKYPTENREALGNGIHRTNQALAEAWASVSLANPPSLANPSTIGLIHSALLGYALLDVTTEFHGLWPTRDQFIDDLVQLVTRQPIAPQPIAPQPIAPQPIVDLPEPLVRAIFQRAQKQGAREWALVYLLFGAGVSAAEIVGLERVHHLSDRDAQVLQITQGAIRQIPVNQWIMGKRYGSYQKNPLTQWLKNRKDPQSALLLGPNEQAITMADIETMWQTLTQDLLTLEGKPPTIAQAQYTWCVEMILRGIQLEDMQILTGLSLEELAPYGLRAKEKAVLEQGLSLDKHK